MRLWEFERVWESKQRTERLRLKKWRLKRWGRVKREGGGVNGKPCPLGVWVWVSVSEATNWRVKTEENLERYHILPISFPPLDFLFTLDYNRWFKLGFDATVTGHIKVSLTSSIPFILNFICDERLMRVLGRCELWVLGWAVGKAWAVLFWPDERLHKCQVYLFIFLL